MRGDGDRTARCENRDAFTMICGGEKLCEAGIYAGAEFRPGLDTFQGEHAADPITDYGFE